MAKGKVAVAIGVTALLTWWILQVGTIDTMPPYAVVFLDDDSQTYLAPSCMEEWRSRASQQMSIARPSTAAEASKLHYKPDHACVQTGAFAEDGRSLGGLLLVKLGILSPVTHWWNTPLNRGSQSQFTRPMNYAKFELGEFGRI